MGITTRRGLPMPDQPALPEVLKVARWLVSATNYPYDFSTSLKPPPELQVAIYEAWIEREAIPEDDRLALWDGLVDEGRWDT